MVDIATINQILSQVSKLEIIIGTVIGIVTTFIGYSIMEWNKNRQFANNIKNYIRYDLLEFSSLIDEITSKWTLNTTTSTPCMEITDMELIGKINSQLPDQMGRFRHDNYSNLTIEIKSQVLKRDISLLIEKIYREIPQISWQMQDGMRFFESKVTNLKKDIENALQKL